MGRGSGTGALETTERRGSDLDRAIARIGRLQPGELQVGKIERWWGDDDALAGKAPPEVPEELIEALSSRVIGEEGNRAMVRPYDSPRSLDEHVATITEGKMMRPRELALFGRESTWTNEDGHETWLGRELLLLDGVEWRGVMYL